MTEDEKLKVAKECGRLLRQAISDDYEPTIFREICTDVVNDVAECADPKEWNEDDVRLAIGRVLLNRLGYNV